MTTYSYLNRNDFGFDGIILMIKDMHEIMMPNRSFASCLAFIAGLLMSGVFDARVIVFGCLMILSTYSSQAVYNNILDIAGDRINAPARPLARGSLSERFAWMLMGFLIVLGFAFAYIAYAPLVLVNIAFIALGVIYSSWSKGRCFFSYGTLVTTHFVLPLLSAYAIFHGIDAKIAVVVLFLYISEVLAISIKDYKDVAGDEKTGIKTLPIVFGIKNAARLTFLGFCIPLVFAWIPWHLCKLSVLFLGIYMVSGIAKIYIGRELLGDMNPKVAVGILKKYRYILMLQMIAWCLA